MFRDYMDRQQPQQSAGFTLLELMVTLAIAAILAAVAAPNFSALIKDNRMSARINDLTSSLSLARSEAIKRGMTVTVCKRNSSDPDKCGSNNPMKWHTGWLIFVDNNGDGTIDANDGIIQVISPFANPLPGNTDLRFNSGKRVSYKADATTGNNGTFTFCDDRGTLKRKGIVISPTGRVRVAKSSDTGLVAC